MAALWMPVLLSAVLVFIVSTLLHIVLRFHKSDWSALPAEERILSTIREAGVAPGSYNFPHPESPADLGKPEMIEKLERGPIGFLTVLPSGVPSMGKSLALWFAYSVAVGLLAAYVTGRTLGPGADYLHVFRVSGTVAFLTYAGSEPVASIWLGRRWSTSLKHMLDGLLYALVTAGAFGWLWPG